MPSSFGGKSASDLVFSLDVLTVITLVAGRAGGERVGARDVKSEVALFLLSVGSLLPSTSALIPEGSSAGARGAGVETLHGSGKSYGGSGLIQSCRMLLMHCLLNTINCCPTSFRGFPDSSVGKECACNSGDSGSIPGLRRNGEGIGYPLQYSGLENSMDCIVHGFTKSLTQLSNFHFTHLFQMCSRSKPTPSLKLSFSVSHSSPCSSTELCSRTSRDETSAQLRAVMGNLLPLSCFGSKQVYACSS